eukprot:14852809-Alexandrium_andersonii.AAC.1
MLRPMNKALWRAPNTQHADIKGKQVTGGEGETDCWAQRGTPYYWANMPFLCNVRPRQRVRQHQ